MRRLPLAWRAAVTAVVLLAAAPVALSGRPGPTASKASDLWLAPSPTSAAAPKPFAQAIADLDADRSAQALPVFARLTSDPVLGGYALLYLGRAQLALGRVDQAAFSAKQLAGVAPGGYLGEAANWLRADAAEAASKWADAVSALEALTNAPSFAPAQAWLRLGLNASKSGDTAKAQRAFAKVYYGYPLSAEATDAGLELEKITRGAQPALGAFALDLGRAQQLFGARRFADARQALLALRPLSSGDDRTLVDLRLAECDFQLKRYVPARDALRDYIDRSRTRQVEAQYYYLSTIRELGREAEYLALVRAFVDGNTVDPLAETALNDLATYHIRQDRDEEAIAVFEEMYRRYPQGAFADRAAWRLGWWAYKKADYAKTTLVFERASVELRRSDYRSAWVYWAARAHAAAGQRDAAVAGYRQTISDYRNSYYGREAAREIARLQGAVRPAASAAATAARPPALEITGGAAPANASLIQAMLAAGLYEDAVFELRRAQDAGTSPLIEASIAYALNRKGDLRPAITTMRRAYPQFMAEGGEALPVEMLSIIFPVEHWDLVQKYAVARKLDPFIMAALINQESTFQADARSVANAWGLMQVLPSTGRRYAPRLGIRPFSTGRLTDPEVNIRIGMAFFADLIDRFGDVAPALAAYNAGDSRVAGWLVERRGMDRDEFIDDIPFPETQNYVKRVIGSAEDYRRLYRAAGAIATPGSRR